MQANRVGLSDAGSVTLETVKIPALISRLRVIRIEMIFFIVLCLSFLF